MLIYATVSFVHQIDAYISFEMYEESPNTQRPPTGESYR